MFFFYKKQRELSSQQQALWDCGQTAKPGGAVGKSFAVLWERPVLFQQAVNGFSIGEAAVFHSSTARVSVLRDDRAASRRQ